MISHWKHALCCALLLGIAIQNHGSAQEPKLSPAARASVQVFLSASGKHDSPAIPDRSELSVSIDKQPAQVISLRSAKDDKLLFAVLVDDSTSNADRAASIKEAAVQLFQSLSVGGNQGYLVVFDASVSTSKRPLQPSDVRRELANIKFRGATAIYDAIKVTCTQTLSRSRNADFPRRAIIVLSDGNDNQSHISPTEAVDAAEKEGVVIFSLVIPSAEGRGEQFLREASRNTGGQINIATELGEGVAPILASIQGQLALGLVSPQAPDQKLHSFAVNCSNKKIHVSAPAHVFIQ